jgi:radical SAM protein with 4Fe4S-binding SPASM domain
VEHIIPVKIQFESATSCNAKCKFCPRYDMTRPKGEMSDELFHKIIQDSKEFKHAEIVPFLNGEPFIFSRIWEWLDYMKDLKVYLFTNAELIDVDRIVKYTNIRYICCSVNAATKETYDKIMRGPDFNKVISNVQELIKKAPFPVYVSMVITEDNKHEWKLFKKTWGKNHIFGEFKNWGGARHDATERSGTRKLCLIALKTMSILWDGRVVACCMDYDGKLILGDVNKQSLMEIYHQSKWFRNKHRSLDFNIEPCKNCNHNT